MRIRWALALELAHWRAHAAQCASPRRIRHHGMVTKVNNVLPVWLRKCMENVDPSCRLMVKILICAKLLSLFSSLSRCRPPFPAVELLAAYPRHSVSLVLSMNFLQVFQNLTRRNQRCLRHYYSRLARYKNDNSFRDNEPDSKRSCCNKIADLAFNYSAYFTVAALQTKLAS